MADGEEDRYEDPAERRNLRFEYRKLIADTEENREEFVQPNSSGLNEALNKVDELYPKVRRTREAALDSQFLLLVSDVGKEQVQHFQTGMVTFEPHTFVEKLITFMGGRHIDEESDDEGDVQQRRWDTLNWSKLGKMAVKSFRRTPTIEFMYGPVSMDAPVKKVRGQKQATGEKPGSAAKVTPEQVVRVENNNEEATTKEVQRVLKALMKVTDQGQDKDYKPVYLFDFITNPNSFSQTVENIFHLSFLINKGNASIQLDEDGLPIVFPTDPYNEQDYDEVVTRSQVVMPFDMNDWKDIVEIYKIKKPMIPTRQGSTNSTTEQDEDMDED